MSIELAVVVLCRLKQILWHCHDSPCISRTEHKFSMPCDWLYPNSQCQRNYLKYYAFAFRKLNRSNCPMYARIKQHRNHIAIIGSFKSVWYESLVYIFFLSLAGCWTVDLCNSIELNLPFHRWTNMVNGMSMKNRVNGF